MADIKYYDVILKPVLTEKSMNAMAEKKYTFLVHPEATKAQVKEAVEKMFEGTKVKSVNTINNDGKKKRRGNRAVRFLFLPGPQAARCITTAANSQRQGYSLYQHQ